MTPDNATGASCGRLAANGWPCIQSDGHEGGHSSYGAPMSAADELAWIRHGDQLSCDTPGCSVCETPAGDCPQCHYTHPGSTCECAAYRRRTRT
jgi:hypothetical protein